MSSRKKQLFKIILLGDSGYVNNKFSHVYRATVGADFMAKDVKIDDRTITLQIWDTAGQERFQSLGGAFYRGADCCVLLYDITELKTFESLESWKEEFILQGCPKDQSTFPFIVIGTKLDKAVERKVSDIKAQQWCKSHGNCQYFETSAKENTNIDQAFQAIAKAASQKEVEEEIFFPTTVDLKKKPISTSQTSSNQCNC